MSPQLSAWYSLLGVTVAYTGYKAVYSPTQENKNNGVLAVSSSLLLFTILFAHTPHSGESYW